MHSVLHFEDNVTISLLNSFTFLNQGEYRTHVQVIAMCDDNVVTQLQPGFGLRIECSKAGTESAISIVLLGKA